MIKNKILIKTQNLSKFFDLKKAFLKKNNIVLKANNNINLSVFQGETLSVVGVFLVRANCDVPFCCTLFCFKMIL